MENNKIKLKELKIKENMQFRMANDFVSRCHWSIKLNNVGKMILFFISSIDYEKEEEIVRSCVPGKELAEYMGVKDADWAGALRKAAAAARKEIIDVPYIAENGKVGWYVSGWVNHVKYNPDTQNVEWEMDGNLKPFFYAVRERLNKITGKATGYIEGVTEHCMKFEHAYSFRVYVLAEQLKGVGGKEFTVEEFAELLKLPKSYKAFGNLKQRVLDQAKVDINKYSDIEIDIITGRPGYKRSNKILKFYLKCTGKVEKLPELLDIKAEEGEDPLKVEARAKLEYYGVNKKVIPECLDGYETEYLLAKIKDCEKRFVEASLKRPIKDSKKAGYIVAAIKDSYDGYIADKNRVQKIAAEKADKEASQKVLAEADAAGYTVVDELGKKRIMTDAEKAQKDAKAKLEAEKDKAIADVLAHLSQKQKEEIVAEAIAKANQIQASLMKGKTFDELINSAHAGTIKEVVLARYGIQTSLFSDED